MTKVVFILALSSDIGQELALRYLDQGCEVIGTYRGHLPDRLSHLGPAFQAFRWDASVPAASGAIADFFRSKNCNWDIFISCIGQLAPIGRFFDLDFQQWEQSFHTNCAAQLGALHAAFPFRRKSQGVHAVLFAGGGTNSPFKNYSAYCLAKIALIKMCELLDDENPDLNIFAVGTGWVRTKVHQQTLQAGPAAGENFEKTKHFLETEIGTSYDDIFKMIEWGIGQGRDAAGGRNFSVVHDPWRQGTGLSEKLRSDTHFFKLRRNGNS